VRRLTAESSQLEQTRGALAKAIHTNQQLEQQRVSDSRESEQTKSALTVAVQRSEQLELQLQQLGDQAKASLGGTMQAQQIFEQQLTLARNEVIRLSSELQMSKTV